MIPPDSPTSQKITRVVKLTFQPELAPQFQAIFSNHQHQIAQMKGCISLSGYQSENMPNVYFTISQWESQQDLDNYRFSAFFKTLWATIKPMFQEKAEAHSLKIVG